MKLFSTKLADLCSETRNTSLSPLPLDGETGVLGVAMATWDEIGVFPAEFAATAFLLQTGVLGDMRSS